VTIVKFPGNGANLSEYQAGLSDLFQILVKDLIAQHGKVMRANDAHSLAIAVQETAASLRKVADAWTKMSEDA
jgi:hypothetical protein